MDYSLICVGIVISMLLFFIFASLSLIHKKLEEINERISTKTNPEDVLFIKSLGTPSAIDENYLALFKKGRKFS